MYRFNSFFCIKKVCLAYICSFSDHTSSVKLPVDFLGQEVEMGFAPKNTILSFSNGFRNVVWGCNGFLKGHYIRFLSQEIFLK